MGWRWWREKGEGEGGKEAGRRGEERIQERRGGRKRERELQGLQGMGGVVWGQAPGDWCLAGNFIRSGATSTQTDIHMGCSHATIPIFILKTAYLCKRKSLVKLLIAVKIHIYSVHFVRYELWLEICMMTTLKLWKACLEE